MGVWSFQHLLKSRSFSLHCLYSFVKDKLSLHVWVYVKSVSAVPLKLCLFFCQSRAELSTVALYYAPSSSSVSSPTLFFNLNVVLNALGLPLFHVNLRISFWYTYNNLLRFLLGFSQACTSNWEVVTTKLSLSNMNIFLFCSLGFFVSSKFCSFLYIDLGYVRFIPKYCIWGMALF